jgi:hypothetical protein
VLRTDFDGAVEIPKRLDRLIDVLPVRHFYGKRLFFTEKVE